MSTPPPTSQSVGRYQLGRFLGRGAAGLVYEATQVLPSGGMRRVALKLQKTTKGLLREARVTSNLRHQNIVDVYEVGEADGRAFCAMELCDGGSLGEVGTLSPRAVVEIGLQVCAALTYAHEALELVHLDIKPQNLLLQHATVKLADLGIARARGFGAKPTLAGTPAFMPPEQWDHRPVDARTDLYALGQTLRLLLGADGQTFAETVDWSTLGPDALNDAHPPSCSPSSNRSGQTLEDVLAIATAADPDARWPSAAAMAHALRSVSAEGPSLAESLGLHAAPAVRRPGLAPQVGRLVGRRTALAALLTALDRGPTAVLHGGAGVGKTALAAVALRSWPGEGLFLDLNAACSAADVFVSVAQVLDVQLSANAPHTWSHQLGRALALRGDLLLVLDAAEGVQEIHAVLSSWASQAEEVRFLVTSRVQHPGEQTHTLELGPLSVDEGIALLQHRAAARGVEVQPGDLARQIVEQLDGLPLAIILAAGRLGVLSLKEVEARLAPAFLRAAEEGRHGTLQGALDGSWELLDPPCQKALAVLSTFEGVASPKDAGALLQAADLEPDATLTALAAHSLLDASSDGLRLFRQVRAYARLQRDRLGLTQTSRQAHAEHFSRLGSQEAQRQLRGPDRRTALDEQRRCLPDLLAAQQHAVQTEQGCLAGRLWVAALPPLEHSGQAAKAETTGAAVSALLADGSPLAVQIDDERLRLLVNLGRLTEGSALIAANAARHSGTEPVLLGINQGILECDRGDHHSALVRLQRAVDTLEQSGQPWAQAHAHNSIANALVVLGRLDEAGTHQDRALALAEGAGDLHTLATVLGNVGNRLRQQGDWPAAAQTYARSLLLHRKDGASRICGHILGNLAYLYRLQGRFAEALHTYDEALAVARFHGDRFSECVQLLNRSIAQLDLQQFSAAHADAHEGVLLADATGLGVVALYGRLHRGKAALRLGRATAAADDIRSGVQGLTSSGAPLLLAEGLTIEAELLLAENQPEAARASLARARTLTPAEERETSMLIDRVAALVEDHEVPGSAANSLWLG